MIVVRNYFESQVPAANVSQIFGKLQTSLKFMVMLSTFQPNEWEEHFVPFLVMTGKTGTCRLD